MPELLGLSLFNDANLQAYYTLEDANDDKNSNNLTNANSVAFNAAKFNNGADSGSSDANKTLRIASNLGYGGGAYSVSFWYKANTAPGTGVFHSIMYLTDGGAGSDTGLAIAYKEDSGLKLVFDRIKWGVGSDNDIHAVDLGITKFHHIVLTYSGTVLKGYLDGTEVASVAASGNGTGTPTTMMILLGQSNDITANNALGIIDDAAFFNRELTADEVLEIYGTTGGGSFLFNFL